MKSLNDKARAERVVATLTRLRSVSNVGTVERVTRDTSTGLMTRATKRTEPEAKQNSHDASS